MRTSTYLLLLLQLTTTALSFSTPTNFINNQLRRRDPEIITDVSENQEAAKNQQSQQSEEGGCVPWREDFNGGFGPFNTEGQVANENGRMVLKISLGDTPNPDTKIIMGYGAKVSSKVKVHFGTLTARIKTARMKGIVSAMVLLSPEKDEIDWEWVGKDETSSQTNYYGKGIVDYTKGLYIKNPFNTHADFHDYTIKWSTNEVVWLIDNQPVRTLTRAMAGNAFPDTPANIFFSLWDGGANLQGTSDWAGGKVDWNDAEYLKNGKKMTSEVEFVEYKCN